MTSYQLHKDSHRGLVAQQELKQLNLQRPTVICTLQDNLPPSTTIPTEQQSLPANKERENRVPSFLTTFTFNNVPVIVYAVMDNLPTSTNNQSPPLGSRNNSKVKSTSPSQKD